MMQPIGQNRQQVRQRPVDPVLPQNVDWMLQPRCQEHTATSALVAIAFDTMAAILSSKSEWQARSSEKL